MARMSKQDVADAREQAIKLFSRGISVADAMWRTGWKNRKALAELQRDVASNLNVHALANGPLLRGDKICDFGQRPEPKPPVIEQLSILSICDGKMNS